MSGEVSGSGLEYIAFIMYLNFGDTSSAQFERIKSRAYVNVCKDINVGGHGIRGVVTNSDLDY